MRNGELHLRHATAALALLASLLIAAGCASPRGGAGARTGPGHRLAIVAGESFWGSIAAQLAGSRGAVHSIISGPGIDPHSYQPNSGDARTVAMSDVAIVNGLGYDRWMSQLLDASPNPGRGTVDVGKTLGLGSGANPHQWYSPASVRRVVDAIVEVLDRADPAGRAYYAGQRQFFLQRSLSAYDRLRELIRARYAGVSVGYSESIFQPLGQDLGLQLATPYAFAKAVAEGTDVTASEKLTVDRQVQQHQVAVWVFNSQNSTPDVQQVNAIARSRGIPIVPITETLVPATDSFQQWQAAELRSLAAALHETTGR